MNMQDKELDELFRTKLGGLEVQPSARVWNNITAELGGENKKSWAPVLSMAATVLVLLAAGTWFLLDKPVKQQQNQVARVKASVNINHNTAPATATAAQPDAVVAPVQSPSTAITGTNQVAKVKARPAVTHQAVETVNAATSITPATAEVQTQPVLAAVPTPPVTHPVVPEIQLANNTINNDAPVLKTTLPANAAAVTASQPEKKRKHGIHSLGDLINVVVSKVDKREDKLIEFTESDDDQSSVTGINLGIIKIKKEK